jgi:hypothetical protein
MGIKFTELPIKAGTDMDSTWVFAVATSTETEQLNWEELQQSFTGLRGQSNSLSLIGGTSTDYGITVSGNGFLGINKTDPSYVLDIGDQGGVTNPQARITTSATNRSASYTLADSSIFWKTTKKASDTDYYIEVSEDDSNYTGAINIDKNGNVGVFDGSFSVPNKFYVYNGDIGFQSGAYKITFDPSDNLEISTNTDALRLNYNNNNGVILGSDVVYVDNSTAPKVGINTSVPNYTLDVYGSGIFTRFNNALTSLSSLAITNTSTTGYITLSTLGFNFGPSAGNSENNIYMQTSTKNVGLGTISPDNKLHVKATGSLSRMAKFENGNNAISEVFQTNNYITGPYSGPRSTLYTFGRANESGPTSNISKWAIGLYDDGPTNTYDDVFVFRVDASMSDSAIKAYLDRDGDFDIKGSYTSNTGNYCKGKFVQTHQTRVTGDCLYFNPFYPNSNTNPSGHNDLSAPFCVTPYAGRIEKIQIFSSDQDMAFSTTNGGRFEISVITPSNDASANNFVSGFYDSPTSPATSLPVSGIVSQFSLASAANPNQVYTYSTFSGSPTFTAGQLLQYRITDVDQRSSYQPAFTVVSTISYTVT